MRLVMGWKTNPEMKTPESNAMAVKWMNNRLNQKMNVVKDHFDKFRISDALMTIYRLIWDDFCSWYLEMVKPPFQQTMDPNTRKDTLEIFEKLMKMLHPFMPFLTEEVYHTLTKRKEGDSIMIAPMPQTEDYDNEMLHRFEFARETVNALRNLRNEKNIPQKKGVTLYLAGKMEETLGQFAEMVKKLAHLDAIHPDSKPEENALHLMVRSQEMFVPFAGALDQNKEMEKLEKELQYQEGFLNGVMKKLSNERFVHNAPPAVVEKENRKMDDAKEKIRRIKAQMDKLQEK